MIGFSGENYGMVSRPDFCESSVTLIEGTHGFPSQEGRIGES